MTSTLAPSLAAAIAAGATIVTPNDRLARRLVELHDVLQRAAGHRAWHAASVLPWRAWLATLWAERAELSPETAQRLLTPAQSSFLWQRIVGSETAKRAPLVDARAAAALAQQAWTTMHAYGAGSDSWRGFTVQGDDEAAFVRWADRFAAALARIDAEDFARVADVLSRDCAAMAVRGRMIVLAGFLELEPQPQRLVAALEAAGASVTRADALFDTRQRVVRAEARSPSEELAGALEWARARAAIDSDATIGIAIADLAERRDDIVALADDVLCPQLQWPGAERSARPYNISLGGALADVPIVAAALDLIALAHAPLPMPRAATLVRSPYLVGAAVNWPQRAAIERRWLKEGRRDVDWVSCATALLHDPALAPRWARLRPASMPSRRSPPRAFVDAWRAWLRDAGWPGDRALASAEFQACTALDELFAAFAALAPVSGDLAPAEALQALRALASETVFQPESPRAPIQIMGLLEAAGMPFDALWIVGLSAQRWPAAPRPHPLLPIAWQRERNVAHASAQREMAYAQALTDQLARGAPEVVASHARVADDHSCLPSALIARWPRADDVAPPLGVARSSYEQRPPLETIASDRAPLIAANQLVRGGTRVIESQSECPFRAVALHRLGVDTWPTAAAGLAPWERGLLLHAALAALWRDLHTHAALVSLASAELDARIAQAVAEAMAKLDPARVRQLPPLVLASEPAHLGELIREWLDSTERMRRPFTVRALEIATEVALAGLRLSLRLDRVDTLDDGGAAILDYKSGEIVPLRRWFDARPSGTQLALYALAWRAAERDTPLRAVTFAQIMPGTTKATGIAADASAWPGLALVGDSSPGAPPDWPSLIAWWDGRIGALARDFANGEAAVDPRERAVCKRCGLQSLCRVNAVASAAEANGDA